MSKRLWLIAGALSAACSAASAQTSAGPPMPAPPPRPAPPATDCTVQARDGGTLQTQMMSQQGTIVFFTDYTVTCDFAGRAQSFTVPASTDRSPFTITAAGASGGDFIWGGCCNPNGTLFPGGRGLGAVVTTQGDVPSGTVLQIFVGGRGKDTADAAGGVGGFNGGGSAYGNQAPYGRLMDLGAGGGGASDVRRAPYGVADRLLVAGGGGGAGALAASSPGSCNPLNGGPGGATGGDGGAGCPHNEDVSRNAGLPTGGRGGSQTAPGAGGDKDPWYGRSQGGTAGSGANGGSAIVYGGGGGGGGGLFGGGSGASVQGGGGGGGSSRGFAGDGGAQVQSGARDGNGQVVLRYRLFTKRVPCVAGMSPKAQVRGETRIFCSRFTPY